MAGWDGAMPFAIFQAFYHQLAEDLKQEKEAKEKAAMLAKTKARAGYRRK